MKKYYVLLITLCVCCVSFAQDYEVENGEIVMKKIIETPLSIEKAHDAVETYFANAYGDSNHTNKMNNLGHIIYIGEYTDLHRYTMGAWTTDARHNIDVAFKEGRVRVKISCSTISCRGFAPNAQQGLSYEITSAAPFVDGGVNKKNTIATFDALLKRMHTTMSGIENALKTPSSTDEDW